MTFNGWPVITSTWMTRSETREVPRPWRDRLWSWPWRPWRATMLVTVQVPSDDVLRVGGRLVMHPATLAKLQARLGEAPRG
jgi:hypothetical protein